MFELEYQLEKYGKYKNVTPVKDSHVVNKYYLYKGQQRLLSLEVQEGQVVLSYDDQQKEQVSVSQFLQEIHKEIELEKFKRGTRGGLLKPKGIMSHARKKITWMRGFKNKANEQNKHFIERLWKK